MCLYKVDSKWEVMLDVILSTADSLHSKKWTFLLINHPVTRVMHQDLPHRVSHPLLLIKVNKVNKIKG